MEHVAVDARQTHEAQPKMIFVSGDRASVGKSTVALGLLGSLLRTGLYKPEEIAYIKPATQCIDVQLVSKYCNLYGIAHRGIGPVVFYTGFTRECIDGQGPSPKELLDKIEEAVNTIAKGKKFVIVDGVGYPSVGSVVGASNAQIAQRLGIPVLLVGRSGVGDAIDSFNINKAYFDHFGVKVLGAVFNKVEDPFEDIKEHVTRYFAQTYPEASAYGFIPLAAHLAPKDGIRREKGACQRETPVTLAISDEEKARAEAVIDAFVERVDVAKIVHDVHTDQADK